MEGFLHAIYYKVGSDRDEDDKLIAKYGDITARNNCAVLKQDSLNLSDQEFNESFESRDYRDSKRFKKDELYNPDSIEIEGVKIDLK